MQYKIQDLPGASGIEHFLANVSHYSLYGFMTIMPASGIAMGYFGGTPLEIFSYLFRLLGILLTPDISIRFCFFFAIFRKGIAILHHYNPGDCQNRRKQEDHWANCEE